MNTIFGRPENTLLDYFFLLVFYALLFVTLRNVQPAVELRFRKTYWVLYWGWAVCVFLGNYLFSLIGIMSFLPWLNNLFHTFLWIGFCLGFLYAGCHEKPLWEQFLLFATYSFVVKTFEHDLLGTWELGNFFGIPGNSIYIIGWSVLDGLYPFISKAGVRLVSRFTDGIILP